ncbi:MAG: SOS response-associated peptidase [Gammaproteobacteria bacterium]|nr:SOS response-associated peptidase [Gammaproteobacteria bacterium]
MCGRYNITDDPDVHALLEHLHIDLGPLPVRYNLAPTDQVPVVHYWEGERTISDMRWWLVPHWSSGPSTKYAMFNARCENLQKSRAYQGSFRHKRAIVPASSFVEWQRSGGQKTPWLFSSPDQALAFAGLWDYWSDGTEHILSCSIVTTEAAPEFMPYHKRMPVMLDYPGADIWLDEHAETADLHKLFEPELPYELQAVPIDSRYNNSRYKDVPIPTGEVKKLSG